MKFGMLTIKTNEFLVHRVQVVFGKSKKKRIRNKRAKDPRNWRTVPDTTIYEVGDCLVMHPWMAAKLIEIAAEVSREGSHGPQGEGRSAGGVEGHHGKRSPIGYSRDRAVFPPREQLGMRIRVPRVFSAVEGDVRRVRDTV